MRAGVRVPVSSQNTHAQKESFMCVVLLIIAENARAWVSKIRWRSTSSGNTELKEWIEGMNPLREKNEGKFPGGGERGDNCCDHGLSRELESRNGGNKKMYGAVVRHRVKNRGLLGTGSSDRRKISASEFCTMVLRVEAQSLTRLFFMAMWKKNWGLALFYVLFSLSLNITIFGDFSTTLILTDTRKKTKSKQASPRFFRVAMKSHHAEFWCSTLKNHGVKINSRNGNFPPRVPNLLNSMFWYFGRHFLSQPWRLLQKQKKWLRRLPHVDAIMSRRFSVELLTVLTHMRHVVCTIMPILLLKGISLSNTWYSWLLPKNHEECPSFSNFNSHANSLLNDMCLLRVGSCAYVQDQ